MDASFDFLEIARERRCEVVLAAGLDTSEARAYDRFVATAPSHYSQTRAWALAQGAAPLYFLARRGTDVIGAGVVVQSRLGGTLLPFARIEHGPVTACPEDLPEVLAALRQATRARGIVRLSVAPYWTDPYRVQVEELLAEAGFSPRRARPSRTSRLDLSRLDDKRSWSAKHLVKIRQDIGRAARAGATVRPGRPEDVVAIAAASADGGAAAAAANYVLGGSGAMFIAAFEGDLISAIFVTLHNGLATFVRGASAARPLPFSPSVLPMTEAVQWARRSGARAFDMDGMEGESQNFDQPYCRTPTLLVREHRRWF